jgi:hypothetical protein
LLIGDTWEELLNIQRNEQIRIQMEFGIVCDATLGDSTYYMLGEADRLEQASIDPLLNPFDFLKWIINRAELRRVCPLKRTRRPSQHEWSVVGPTLGRYAFEVFRRNLQQVGEALWAPNLEFLDSRLRQDHILPRLAIAC